MFDDNKLSSFSFSFVVSGSTSGSSGKLRKRIASLVKRFILIRAANKNINKRKINIPIGINNVKSDSKLLRKQLKKKKERQKFHRIQYSKSKHFFIFIYILFVIY